MADDRRESGQSDAVEEPDGDAQGGPADEGSDMAAMASAATTEQLLQLPTPADYQRAVDALQTGYNELEHIAWVLSDLAERNRDNHEFVAVTLADIGALWAFTDDVSMQLSQAGARLDEIETRLHDVDIIRREAGRPRLTATQNEQS
jgi:hypothetical protein